MYRPVSYTHLDVYKRQGTGVVLALFRPPCGTMKSKDNRQDKEKPTCFNSIGGFHVVRRHENGPVNIT